MSSMIQEMQTFMKFSHPERRSICLLLDFTDAEINRDLGNSSSGQFVEHSGGTISAI